METTKTIIVEAKKLTINKVPVWFMRMIGSIRPLITILN